MVAVIEVDISVLLGINESIRIFNYGMDLSSISVSQSSVSSRSHFPIGTRGRNSSRRLDEFLTELEIRNDLVNFTDFINALWTVLVKHQYGLGIFSLHACFKSTSWEEEIDIAETESIINLEIDSTLDWDVSEVCDANPVH